MIFADLFRASAREMAANEPLRRVRRELDRILTSRENFCPLKEDTTSPTGKDSGIQPSAPSAPLDRPPLVPLEMPFIEGKRYRLAPATEWPSRLDLYVEDTNGNTVRKHGMLLAVRLL